MLSTALAGWLTGEGRAGKVSAVIDDVVLRWLSGRSSEQLAALLHSRPSLLGAGPDEPPRSLAELAGRLRDPRVTSEVVVTMPTPLL
jgi:hypothetical protein